MRCMAEDCRENLEGDCQISSYICIDGSGRCDSYDPIIKDEG